MGAAARITDMHTCPMTTGTVPHVGGPLLPGSNSTVFIGGLPASVVGDSCVCTGPPDSLAAGSSSVFIAGSPAVRMGDSTAHGGVVTGGCPQVMIGG
ncbi:MAG: type VI secretion protein [Flavobacterium sp.]|uniref:PAAR domain-containing protein n=1 Tax=Flavobacterium sp. TaxID=239 RepID=UPI000C5857EA|nr:PAAR domain-containing protein [Flavobacterium sp.]MBF04208.1 type VI secretion protein [Flavobacterium sp.]|tara:strand:+ start:230 stop:520 length:291 start_codon:yes stop_codon:yes gene_type:complete